MSLLGLFTTRQTRVGSIAALLLCSALVAMRVQPLTSDFNDAHLYLPDCLQPRSSLQRFLELLDARAGRAALIASPVESGSLRPRPSRTYDAPGKTDPPPYDSFTDVRLATVFKTALTTEQQARFDPMITAFNPADMYAPDYIRRVLETFPGVFTGIAMPAMPRESEAQDYPGGSNRSPSRAFDRLLDFATEAGLIVLIGNNGPAREGPSFADLTQFRTELKAHPNTTLIWAHSVAVEAAEMEKILADPDLSNVYFDVSSEQASAPADLITRFSDRFLFGTEEIAQSSGPDFRASRLSVPPWFSLSPAISTKIRKSNYERIFDRARHNVRAWEKAHLTYPQ